LIFPGKSPILGAPDRRIRELTQEVALKKTALNALLAIGVLLLAPGLPAQTPQPDPAPLLGAWLLEVNAGEIYMLPLTLKLVDGKLSGTLSEQSGMFTDIPLTDITWDGTLFKCGVKIPTPPDGAERPVKTEFKIEQGKLVGMIIIEEMGLVAPAVGTKR
jgi:hypothetical protein